MSNQVATRTNQDKDGSPQQRTTKGENNQSIVSTPDNNQSMETQENQKARAHRSKNKQEKQPLVRKVTDYLVYVEDVLGIGQYGKVCKAQKQEEVKQKIDKTYACKIIEIVSISKEDMDCIEKEVRLHNLVQSQYSVRLYQTIKTSSNIYMMMEYCNGSDLAVLLSVRKQLNQMEVSLILRQVIKGLLEIWQLHMIHRDMKLANILLNFPNNPEVASMNKNQRRAFLGGLDLTKIKFDAKISDFGLSTILESSTSQLSICGTPLYSAPQLLKKRGYSYKVDIWALGIMCYELLMGKTPFHSFEMNELLEKINEGKYTVQTKEPLSVECALFLTQCLQANEADRISMSDLMDHPFITCGENVEDGGELKLTVLDHDDFQKDMLSVSELQNGSNLKQTFTPRLQTMTGLNAVEFTTQESVQSKILKSQLQNQKNYATKFPRLEIEETKEVMVDEIEVEDPLDKKRNEELLLIQRQYQGSVDQRNLAELEIDDKRRSSIIIQQNVGADQNVQAGAARPGGFVRFFSFMAEKMCGTNKEPEVVAKGVKQPAQPLPVTSSQAKVKESTEDMATILKIKKEREAELEVRNSAKQIEKKK